MSELLDDELPDGTLQSWSDVQEQCDWGTLLIGNGLSCHVWEGFGYPQLFERAQAGHLDSRAKELFAQTPNFERVLGDLLTTIRVCRVHDLATDVLYDQYESIQQALGEAVRAVHLNRDKVPEGSRRHIADELGLYDWVFTTNYDLLLYWSMACDGFDGFTDHFGRVGDRLAFDSRRLPPADETAVYFLHGALHLVVAGDGQTLKRRQSMWNLLEQFGLPIKGDPDARPLLVTEGSTADKLAAIEGNSYLSKAYEQLRENQLDLVIFGSRLGPEDDHIADAISRNPDRTVAVSMRQHAKRELLRRQTEIHGRLKVRRLVFFDAATHPLGHSSLQVSDP